MAEQFAIKVENVSKSFKLPHDKQGSVKGALINFRKRGYEKQVVLKNIDFEIKKGEFFGIVGRNGSGKSTLLKLLAGIYSPDKGEVHVRGKLTPFIELGVGFNAELTGKDNVFLNGALLGFSRKEMLAMYDEIVSFAELERFMDQKLKNYSSGMQVRLAFSIAIKAKTDILLIDEVLAVGDANFQRKCINKFSEIKASGRTVVFISHDMGAIRKFCDRVMMIQNGEIVNEGLPDEVASTYEVANIDTRKTIDTINNDIAKAKHKVITRIELLNAAHKQTTIFKAGDVVTVAVTLLKGSPAKNLGVALYTVDGGYILGANTIYDRHKIGNKVEYNFKADLGRGEYMIKLGVFGKDDGIVYEFFDEGPSFIIEPPHEQAWEGAVLLEHTWKSHE